MTKPIGWSDTKIIDNKMYVLAEMNDGQCIVLVGDIPDEIRPEYGWQKYPYEPKEEIILEHGNPLDFDSARRVFKQLKKENYVKITSEAQ